MLGAAVPAVRRIIALGGFGIAVVLPCLVYGGLMVRFLRASGSA